MLMQVDVHQHVWTAPLVEALASRHSLPFIARADGLMLLHCAGERPYIIDVAAETPGRRAQLLASDRIDRAIVAVSSPIGIEALPRESSGPLIDAYLEGVGALGERFAAWGPLALQESSPEDVDELLGRGCIGISYSGGSARRGRRARGGGTGARTDRGAGRAAVRPSWAR